jgi:hypothetical protein
VREAQATINAYEFAEWQAWTELEPWGSWYEDVRIARMQSTMANLLGRQKNQKAFQVSDFLPQYDKQEPAMRYAPKAQRLAKLRLALDTIAGGRH